MAAMVSLATAPNTSKADEFLLTFNATLNSYSGPAGADPFNPTSLLGSQIAANPDLGILEGQFIVKDFDANFTGTITTATSGAELFIHSPVLERVEAYTTRVSSSSPLGTPVNTKYLLPRTATTTTTDENGLTSTGFFGTATATFVNGEVTSFSYSQGPDTLASFDFRFDPFSIEGLDITTGDETGFELVGTFDLDTPGDADAVPYGFFNTLTPAPSSTVLQTTRGDLAIELAAGAILDGRESSGGQPLDFDPLDGTGTLYYYDTTSLDASLEVVPEPSTYALLGFGGAALFALRRFRRRK